MINITKIILALAFVLALQPYNTLNATAQEGTIIDGTVITSEPFDQDEEDN